MSTLHGEGVGTWQCHVAAKRIVLLTLAVLLLAACNTGSAPTPTPVSVNALVEEASQVLSQAKSFRVIIERAGAPVYIDTADTTGIIEFMRAEAEYASPDRIHADVKIKIGGLVAQGNFIAIGADQYLSNPTLTGGRWLLYTFIPGLDPAAILAENGGLQTALRSVRELQLVGVEDVDRVRAYHIRGVGDGRDVSALTLGLIGGYNVNVDAWISVDGLRVIRVEVEEPNRPLPEGRTEPPSWVIELYDYNAPVEVETPTDFAIPEPTATPTPPVAPPQPAPGGSSS